MSNYSVNITEASKELKARDKIRYKDFPSCISIDASIPDDRDPGLTINPAAYAIADVHNEMAENKDYRNFIIEDSDGNLYVTSSAGAFQRFQEIFDTMREDAPDENYTVTFYKRPSSKYKGKFMIMCKLD